VNAPARWSLLEGVPDEALEDLDEREYCKRCHAKEAGECVCADEALDRQKESEMFSEVKQWTF
jgi:hypothetical protein